MAKVSSSKIKAFVEKAKMGKYKTPDNDANFSGKVKVPQSQTVTNSKADERNLTSDSTPAEEDAKLMDKYEMDWQGIDKLERDVQDIGYKQEDEDRGPSSGFSDKSRRKYTLNLSKMRRK